MTTVYDYTALYTRMAVALETIATNSTSIKNSLAAIETDIDNISTKSTTIADKQTTIADKQTTIADKQTLMEAHQNIIKQLGQTVGYRIRGPYDIFGMVSLYKLFIQEGRIFDDVNTVSQQRQQEALQEVINAMQKVNENIPKEF